MIRASLFFMENTLSLTKYWLEKIVIGLDLCPFARIPYELGLVRTVECLEDGEEEMLASFLEELERLNDTDARELSTTLIVYPNGPVSFLNFNDFVMDLEGMLEEADLSEVFQLVAFHPQFVFDDTDFEEVGNLVNRAPFPILQIIRAEEIMNAMKNPKDGEAISMRNDKKLNALSTEARDSLFFYLKK